HARLDAIAVLAHTPRPQVRNRLAAQLEPTADGGFAEPDAQVRQAAARAVRTIDRLRAVYGAVETLFFGLSVGSVLVLVAVALAITVNRLCIIVFTLVVFAILLIVLKRTRLGLAIRAVSQNRAMAQAMGIRTNRVDAMTFGLGSGIAGVAGVALSQFTNVGPNLGQSYIVDSFMVVVFGGVGNLWGTLAGGMSMGVVNQLLEPYAGAVLAKIFVLVALILFIQRCPRGLCPHTGRASVM